MGPRMRETEYLYRPSSLAHAVDLHVVATRNGNAANDVETFITLHRLK